MRTVVAGAYLAPGFHHARGYPATLVEITRWLSILSSISTIGRESVNVRVSKDY